MEKKIYSTFRYVIMGLSLLSLVLSILVGIYGLIKISTKTDIPYDSPVIAVQEPNIDYSTLINEMGREDQDKGRLSSVESRKDKIPTNLRPYFDSIKWSVRDFLAKSGNNQANIDNMMSGFEDQLFDITRNFGEFQESSLKNLQAQMNKLLDDQINLQNVRDGKPIGVSFQKFFPWFLKKFNAALQAEKERVQKEEQKQRDAYTKMQQSLMREKELGQQCLAVSGIAFGVFLSLSTLVALFGIESNTRKTT